MMCIFATCKDDVQGTASFIFSLKLRNGGCCSSMSEPCNLMCGLIILLLQRE